MAPRPKLSRTELVLLLKDCERIIKGYPEECAQRKSIEEQIEDIRKKIAL